MSLSTLPFEWYGKTVDIEKSRLTSFIISVMFIIPVMIIAYGYSARPSKGFDLMFSKQSSEDIEVVLLGDSVTRTVLEGVKVDANVLKALGTAAQSSWGPAIYTKRSIEEFPNLKKVIYIPSRISMSVDIHGRYADLYFDKFYTNLYERNYLRTKAGLFSDSWLPVEMYELGVASIKQERKDSYVANSNTLRPGYMMGALMPEGNKIAPKDQGIKVQSAFKDGLEEIIAMTQDAGVELVIGIAPTDKRFYLALEDFIFDLQKKHNFLFKVVPVFYAGLDESYFYDKIHFKPEYKHYYVRGLIESFPSLFDDDIEVNGSKGLNVGRWYSLDDLWFKSRANRPSLYEGKVYYSLEQLPLFFSGSDADEGEDYCLFIYAIGKDEFHNSFMLIHENNRRTAIHFPPSESPRKKMYKEPLSLEKHYVLRFREGSKLAQVKLDKCHN